MDGNVRFVAKFSLFLGCGVVQYNLLLSSFLPDPPRFSWWFHLNWLVCAAMTAAGTHQL